MSNPTGLSLYLLSIRGTLAAATLEASRAVHNRTAGAPENVAAAQSLGDLSHMVYVPLEKPKEGAGEFLIMDIWNNLDGLNQFFANPTVQEQAGQIFTSRDPLVWTAAAGFAGYHIPAPYGKNERVVALVRGTVPSVEKALAIHNAGAAKMINKSRKAGALSHEAYFRMAAPNSPEALEFFAVDVWMGHDGMHEFYDQPEFMQTLDGLFTAEPDFSVWTHPAGEWAEW
ncbi:MAG TPA: PA domain-containing protein [Anaerolineales bacterium]|nr:PA domain-containing protein [Anaerolineales bacterium]